MERPCSVFETFCPFMWSSSREQTSFSLEWFFKSNWPLWFRWAVGRGRVGALISERALRPARASTRVPRYLWEWREQASSARPTWFCSANGSLGYWAPAWNGMPLHSSQSRPLWICYGCFQNLWRVSKALPPIQVNFDDTLQKQWYTCVTSIQAPQTRPFYLHIHTLTCGRYGTKHKVIPTVLFHLFFPWFWKNKILNPLVQRMPEHPHAAQESRAAFLSRADDGNWLLWQKTKMEELASLELGVLLAR